ncbi:hypothetical protein C6P52_09560 [Enterococcus mundtii]|uniref:Ig-like domain repeat protein n=1 Tax=Enterococcus mundtii TaxID=53346 RepID=UPI000D34065F|nr:Ig-like domain repeat protein [Enterococcus mundtii]PTO38313.1 hypothetical protein C6P52_09560 [Enterococcus mundtii]PTO43029.1 hypothetical protein C6P54_10890 [Enterococcus mundtii]
MKAKKIRMIATSFLLFQHALLPSAVFAIENEPIASTEITEEQPESHLSEETPEVAIEEPTVEEPIVQEEASEEPILSEQPAIVEEAQVIEEEPVVPEEPTTDIPAEETVLPPLDENSLVPSFLPRLNLTTENVNQLTNHGRSSYLEGVLQKAINRTVNLASAANSTASFSVTVPTHSLVERVNDSNGWISSIVTDSDVGMPDEFYTQMYYGNHPTHRNTYTLTNISSSSAAVSVVATVTVNTNFTATIDFTVTRVQAGNEAVSLDIRGNVGLGTTGVATYYPEYATPRKVMDLSYSSETIGRLSINPIVTYVIKNPVTIEAQRPAIVPTAIIRDTWFDSVPTYARNYYYYVSGTINNNMWYPGRTGSLTVNVADYSNSIVYERFPTNYVVVDTTPPEGTAVGDFVTVQANRHRDFTQEELRLLVNGLKDNWSELANITLTFERNLNNLSPGTSYQDVRLKMTDESGNERSLLNTKLRIADTIAPTGTVKSETIDLSGVTTDIPSRSDLMAFLNNDLDDNWTLPENIKIDLVDSNGSVINLQDLESEDNIYTGYIRLEDEQGNQSSLQEVKFQGRDAEGPTGNVTTSPVDFQARRKDELTRDDLLRFFTDDPLDNVTPTDQLDLSLRNNAGDVVSIVNVAPSTTVYDAKVRLQDQANNKTEYPVNYRVVDTQAPTGSVKGTWTVFEANRHRDFTQEELRMLIDNLTDNWTELENIQLQNHRHLYDLSPNRPIAYHPMDITAIDEAGNDHVFTGTMPKIVDTTAPTANFKDEVIDFSTLTSNTFSRTDLLKFFNGNPDDNWSLPENITIELVDSEGNEFELDDLEYKEYTGFIRLEDEQGNQSELQEVKFLAGDNEGPTGNVVTQPVDFQARRKEELTKDELLQFFTEDPLDNTTPTDQIDLSLCNDNGDIVSIVNVAPSPTVYDANVRLEDIRGNYTDYDVKYRVVDTQAPTGSINQEITIFEATRSRDFTQEELRSLLIDLEDNWTERESITLKNNLSLQSLRPNSLGEWYYQVHVDATDEAGNTIRIEDTKVRIEDTTAPDGTLKDPLVFTKGQTAPEPREFLDGDPTDNWSLSPDIQVEVAYENNVQFTDLAVGDHGVTITLTDQAGNARTLNSQVTILEDTSEYIDVTIPVNVSFAESKESNGIVSPTYQIQNNAERAVQVSVSSVVSQSDTEKLTEIDLGVKNNLNDNQVMLISSGQNLNNRRELGTIEGHSTSFSFSLFGTVGENFDFESLDDPLNPIYSMRLNFHAQ